MTSALPCIQRDMTRKSKTELDAAAFYVSANRFTLLVLRASQDTADAKRDKDDGEHNAPGG